MVGSFQMVLRIPCSWYLHPCKSWTYSVLTNRIGQKWWDVLLRSGIKRLWLPSWAFFPGSLDLGEAMSHGMRQSHVSQLGGELSSSQALSWLQPRWHPDCNLVRDLSHNHRAKLQPDFWPPETVKNGCFFWVLFYFYQPLSFKTICYAAMDN